MAILDQYINDIEEKFIKLLEGNKGGTVVKLEGFFVMCLNSDLYIKSVEVDYSNFAPAVRMNCERLYKDDGYKFSYKANILDFSFEDLCDIYDEVKDIVKYGGMYDPIK